eukprot:RCo042442
MTEENSTLPCLLDLSRLLAEFAENAACPSLAAFRQAWEALHFGSIFLGVKKTSSAKHFLTLLLTSALGYLVINADFNTKLFAVYAVFFLYEIQCKDASETKGKVRVPVSPELYEELGRVYQMAVRLELAEVVQIFHKLVKDNAFEFHAIVEIGHISEFLTLSSSAQLDESWTSQQLPDDTALLTEMTTPTTLQHVLELPELERHAVGLTAELCELSRRKPSLKFGDLPSDLEGLLADLMDAHTRHRRRLKELVSTFDPVHTMSVAEGERKRRRISSYATPIAVVCPTSQFLLEVSFCWRTLFRLLKAGGMPALSSHSQGTRLQNVGDLFLTFF